MFSVHFSSMESVARANLRKTVEGYTQTIMRLSTGKRINSPKDDPSGFVATQMIRSDIARAKGTLQSNQSRGSMLSVVDSGLGNIMSLLNQAKGLIVAGANTGALSQEQISAYQTELDSTLEMIERILKSTSFQGKNVLEGLTGLLNGTLTDEQRDQVLGITKNFKATDLLKETIDTSRIGTVQQGDVDSKEASTLGSLSDELLAALKTAEEIQKKLGGEGAEENTSSSSEIEQILEEIQIEQKQSDILTAVGSWVLDRFGVDGEEAETVRQNLINDLFEQTLITITNNLATDQNSPENENSGDGKNVLLSLTTEELIEQVSENLETLFSDGEEVSLEQAVEKLDVVKRETAELEEQKRLEEEELAKALAEKEALAAEKAEKELREKEQAEKLAALKEHADKMYFLTRKDMPQVELVQDRVEEKTQREERAGQVKSFFENRETTFVQRNTVGEGNIKEKVSARLSSQLLAQANRRKSTADLAADAESSEQEKNKLLFQAIQNAIMSSSEKDSKKTDELKKDEEKSEQEPGITITTQSNQASVATVDDLPIVGINDSDSLTTGKMIDTSNNPDSISIDLQESGELDITAQEAEVVARTIDDLKRGGIADLRNNPEAADKYITGLIDSFSLKRTINAIEQNSLEVDNTMLTNELFHLQDLDAQISDADFAEEMSNLIRYQVLMHTGTKALEIAQNVTKLALNFLNNAASASLLMPGKNK